MRITVHLPDDIGEKLRKAARQEEESVSSFVAGAVVSCLIDKRRRKAGRDFLNMAGHIKIKPGIYEELERGRKDFDRF